ncbi:MAG: hypothetical protein FWD38_08000 [Oscillospiraceae bacterium]|nr:hypothetical protein [Oscillospiraceae bacterium]
MNNQTKASFNKEFLAFFRTNVLITVALVIIGLAVLSPVMIAGMGMFMDAMSDLYEEMGTDVSGMTELLGESVSLGVQSAVESIVGVGLIVMIILLNKAAGGEQKKRAVIIPKSSGLRSFSYILPKFIIYPLSGFVFSIIATLAAWAVSIPLFDKNDVMFATAFLAGILSGVAVMLYICFHLALGTATGKAGMSAAVCITVSVLLPTVMSQLSTDYMYNPFTLQYLAALVLQAGNTSQLQASDIIVSIAFALAIMVVAFLVALFAQNARRIDNYGNEIDL